MMDKEKGLLGYELILDDGKCDMYDWDKNTHGEQAKYGTVYDLSINSEFRCRNKKDLFYCDDGFDICSKKFYDFCKGNEYEGIEFIPLPKSPGKFVFRVHNIKPLDKKRDEIRYVDPNPEGEGFMGIYRNNNVYLDRSELIEDGFFRADIFFGDHFTKHPILLCGIETKNKMKKAGFTPFFSKVMADYPPYRRSPGSTIAGVKF